MHTIAKFEFVSESRYITDWFSNVNYHEGLAKQNYTELQLPKRATKGSAGYDFFAPFSFTCEPGKTICIPTGIRAKIAEGWLLALFPRSSLGFRYRLQLNNTVGIVDGDYYEADNEGHIFIKMTNCSEHDVIRVRAGEAFAQGIFLPFGLAEEETVEGKRRGGIGSTNKT